MKKHVVVIHGGDVFHTNEEYLDFLREFEIKSLDYFTKIGWKDNLQEDLGDEYLVIRPKMPNKYNAQYMAWKIWFEKLFPFLNDNVVLIGHSLGGTFLAKYLSENTFPKTIQKLFLIAAPFNMAEMGESNGDFIPPEDYSNLGKQCGEIYLYHSHDDRVVPFSEVEKYQKVLPTAIIRAFDDKGHFNMERFPEIVNEIVNK